MDHAWLSQGALPPQYASQYAVQAEFGLVGQQLLNSLHSSGGSWRLLHEVGFLEWQWKRTVVGKGSEPRGEVGAFEKFTDRNLVGKAVRG